MVGLPLLAGLLGRAYVGLLWTVLLGLAAVVTTVSDDDTYDTPGAWLHLYSAAALVSALALLSGAAVRRAVKSKGAG